MRFLKVQSQWLLLSGRCPSQSAFTTIKVILQGWKQRWFDSSFHFIHSRVHDVRFLEEEDKEFNKCVNRDKFLTFSFSRSFWAVSLSSISRSRLRDFTCSSSILNFFSLVKWAFFRIFIAFCSSRNLSSEYYNHNTYQRSRRIIVTPPFTARSSFGRTFLRDRRLASERILRFLLRGEFLLSTREVLFPFIAGSILAFLFAAAEWTGSIPTCWHSSR